MTPPRSDNPLVASVAYGHKLGWSFTPLAGKKPVLRAWQNRPRETLQEALAWAAKGNVGLRTGNVSGVIAVDKDPEGDLAAIGLAEVVTVTAITGRPDAEHLYFEAPDEPTGNSVGKLAPHIDVRGEGGQVVFPGSVHPDTGTRYAWAPGRAPWEVPLAKLPAHVIEKLNARDVPTRAPTLAQDRKVPAKSTQRPTQQQRYARMALRLELNAVYTAANGARNETLNKAAFSLGTLVGGGYLDRGEVEQTLLAAVEGAGWDYDNRGRQQTVATIRSGLEAGIKQPRVIPDRPEPAKMHIEPARPIVDSDLPVLPRGQFKLDLYGNADRFMDVFGRDVHWCEERGRWYVWDGRVWQPDSMRQVSRLAELVTRAMVKECAGDEDAAKWAARCNRAATPAREMLEVVKHRTAIGIDQLDRHCWMFGTQNGIIDLRSGRLLSHDRDHLITRLSPTIYDPDATCPRWGQFLAEIMPGDDAMISALQRMAGYFLTGDISVQILPIFYGPGGNGKNVFLDTLMGVLGPHAAEAPDSLLTVRHGGDEHPTEIADLLGKRLVVASETEENRKMRIGLVKKLTGNKYLKGRFMRQDYFQFERTHKTVLVTNNKPIVTETSNAIWRRLRLIPFEVIIPEASQDRQLTEKLVAEWPGILTWAVEGCLDWQQRQCDLELPKAVAEATKTYRNDSDHVADFLTECCVDWGEFPEQKMKTPKERVYTSYCTWCRNIGEDVLNRTAFNSRVRGHGFVDKVAKVDGRAQKCWMNITLRADPDEIYS